MESTTAPLDEVTFPMMTICNINQLRRSYMMKLNLNQDADEADFLDNDFSLIMDEYINGRIYNLTSDQSETLRILDLKRGNR